MKIINIYKSKSPYVNLKYFYIVEFNLFRLKILNMYVLLKRIMNIINDINFHIILSSFPKFRTIMHAYICVIRELITIH